MRAGQARDLDDLPGLPHDASVARGQRDTAHVALLSVRGVLVLDTRRRPATVLAATGHAAGIEDGRTPCVLARV